MSLPTFIQSLLGPACYPHTVTKITIIETHISWVVLTGEFAYKIKKPIDLGFLDYTTLDRRRFFCAEEIRLNRRLAPDLYLCVAPIGGTEYHPRIGDAETPPFEYAVKMRQFTQDALLSTLAEQHRITTALVDDIAHRIAKFHGAIAITQENNNLGTPKTILDAMQHNFSTIRSQWPAVSDNPALDEVERWTSRQFENLVTTLHARKQAGHIRECHGDMHLGNIALINGAATIFDGIEFNDSYRWIDTISELAFLLMDLDDRRTSLSRRTLNGYLHDTGDYKGLKLLRFYQVYRAMVRAKVEAIRASQKHASAPAGFKRCAHYIALARTYTDPPRPSLFITHGLSGSGKSTLSTRLAEHTDAIWIRSDIERKRLYRVTPLQRTGAELSDGIYDDSATAKTYRRLFELAKIVLDAQYPVLVDATFLQTEHRALFRHLAQDLDVPFRILDFAVSERDLIARIKARNVKNDDPSDANIAVLHQQLSTQQPLSDDERRYTLKANLIESIPPDELHQIVAGEGSDPLD